MAVDGPNNTVVEVDTIADPPGPDNPWDNALSVVETPLTTEKAARRRADAARMRSWKIVNRDRKTALGHHPGYGWRRTARCSTPVGGAEARWAGAPASSPTTSG